MEQRDKILEEYYAQMGIAKPVYDFCMKVEEELKDRFLSIDKTAECNQMKVLRAMQKNHLSEACFAPTTGYGYNDICLLYTSYYISIFLFPSVFLKSREQLILLFQILQRIFLPLNRLF